MDNHEKIAKRSLNYFLITLGSIDVVLGSFYVVEK